LRVRALMLLPGHSVTQEASGGLVQHRPEGLLADRGVHAEERLDVGGRDRAGPVWRAAAPAQRPGGIGEPSLACPEGGGGAQRVEVPVEGRGGPLAPLAGQPFRQPADVVLAVEFDDREAGAGRGELA